MEIPSGAVAALIALLVLLTPIKEKGGRKRTTEPKIDYIGADIED